MKPLSKKKDLAASAKTAGVHARHLGATIQSQGAAYQAAILLMMFHDHRKEALRKMAHSWENVINLKDK